MAGYLVLKCHMMYLIRLTTFSGHYQCYGLNIQAMCDPDLIFLFWGVAAPGKVNDVRAFLRCDVLIEWLQKLPPEFFIGGDNPYSLSRGILIPFSGAEKVSKNIEHTIFIYPS
jgi:hypothetical protein